jgi:hypothetical protein
MNLRRGWLLDRKYDRGLSPEESAELASLQEALHRYIDCIAPLPIAAARSLHAELKAASAKGKPNK